MTEAVFQGHGGVAEVSFQVFDICFWINLKTETDEANSSERETKD